MIYCIAARLLLGLTYEQKCAVHGLPIHTFEGESIRIGWQLDFNEDKIPDLEHWIDGKFLTIMNGLVFNQIEPI